MNITRDIQPIGNLKKKTAELLRQLEETGEPVVLTENGEPKAVIQNAEAYQELVEMKQRLETILSVRAGLEEMEAGRTKPAEKVFERLEKKYKVRD